MNQTIEKKNNLRSILRWILWVLLVQFLLINISAMFYAHKLTYFYTNGSSAPPSLSSNVFSKTWRIFTGPKFYKADAEPGPPQAHEDFFLKTKNGDSLSVTSMSGGHKGTVILIHPLGTNKYSMLTEAYEFLYLGYNIMLVDLRAHGASSGHVTTFGIRESEDVKLAFDAVAASGEKKIILYGYSLGAVAVIKAIADYGIKPERIIVDEPFESLVTHLRGRARILGFPSEPFATLVTFWSGVERGFNGFRHNTCDYAEKINCPVLVQYGARDNLVLPRETRRIFDHIRFSQKKLVEYPDAVHESLVQHDPSRWRKEMQDFL
jgi:uncharacterized protein